MSLPRQQLEQAADVPPRNAALRRLTSPKLTPARARLLLVSMYRARRFDEVAVALQRQGAISGYGQAVGQEAAQVGAALAFAPDEMVFPSYRQPGPALLRGIRILELLTYYARLDPCPWDWRSVRFAPWTVPLGSQLAHAVGWAMAEQRAGLKLATLTFFGDGASSQGETHEAMNFAAVARAPVVFLCENNGWAISTPVAKQTRAPALFLRAQGYGMPGYLVDGTDVLKVLETVIRARRVALATPGPVLIEATCYRMGGHTTSDDPSIYRSDEEVARWKSRDPIDGFARDCVDKRVLDTTAIARLKRRVDREMDIAVAEWLSRNG
jgi:2-oxoisovalerate dehydrogenase E1 component alpha subunit